MALAIGLSVANPFYGQSLLPAVRDAFGLLAGQVLLGPMATQLGMGLGGGGVVLAPSLGLLLVSWFALGLVALIPSLLFGCFMALWSSMALHLGGAPWRFGPALIGSFGLVGIVSIAAAPVIGRLVDRIGAEPIVVAGVLTTAAGVLLLGLWPRSLLALVLGLMALDLGVQGSFVANQARIDALDPAARSRMSGQLFLTAYLGAAACSAVISWFWATWGWPGTCVFALVLVLLALLIERDGWWLPFQRPLPRSI